LFDCDHGGQDENKQCTDQEADGPTIDEHVVLTGEGWGWRSCSARNAFGDVRHVRRLDRRRQDPSVPRRGSGTIGPARRWPLASIPKQRSATPNEDQANTVPTWLTGAQPTRSRPTRARPSISRSPKTAFFPLQRLDWIRKRQFERGRPRRHLSNEIACSRTQLVSVNW
jgi:hypothetical protein